MNDNPVDFFRAVSCPRCKAPPGQPCHSGTGHVYKDSVHAGRRRRTVETGTLARVSIRMVHCPYCRAGLGEPCRHASGATMGTHHRARRQRYRAALAQVIPAADVTGTAMVHKRNELKHSRIIAEGRVRNWVGFGWVDEGPPKFDDDLLPRVIEAVSFMQPHRRSFV
jgi:hypothetical protein